MARYIDEKDVYKLVEPSGVSRVHCSQIDELPRADVVPKSEVAKEICSDLKKLVRNKAIYPGHKDAYGFIGVDAFDGIVRDVLNKYLEGEKDG